MIEEAAPEGITSIVGAVAVWGLIERDRETGAVVGLEYWRAREHLPAELLEALPAPPAREVVVERQPA